MIRLDIDDHRWMAFVDAQGAAEPFHHPAWARLLSQAYGYPAFALAGTDPEGRVIGGLPFLEVHLPLRAGRRWVALPFTDVCPPLLSDGLGSQQLAEELDAQRQEASVPIVEVRSLLESSVAFPRAAAVRHLLELDRDLDRTVSGFRSNFRRNARRARAQGVRVRLSTSIDDITDVFYRLHVRTRRRQGVPVQPRRFFALFWRHIIDRGLGFVAVAETHDQPVASAVFLAWHGTIIYKYGASEQRFLGLRPNHLLFAQVIEWACSNGYVCLDFGRTDVDNAGLRSFKSGWGAVEEPLTYSRIGRPWTVDRRSIAAPARPLLRHGPLWLTRGLGEALYRYFW